MRVLHLATTYPLHAEDSNATFVESIVEGLNAAGCESDVLVPWHPELVTRRATGTRVIGFRYSPLRSWHPWGYAQALTADRTLRRDAYLAAPLAAACARRAIRRLHREAPYDLLHAHWFLPNGAIAASAWKSTGLPLVVSCHGSGVYLAERHGWAARLGRYVGSHADVITACSADLASRVDDVGRGPAAVRVPYGVDTARFCPLDADALAPRREELAARHGIRPDDFWVFAIGRLVFKKGFDVLIEAAAALRDRGLSAQVLIAGEGPLRQDLLALAERHNVADRVHLIGAVANAGVPDYYATADAVAVPSVHGPDGNVDGLPNTLLEALSTGAAVVCSRVAGIPDVVRHGDNGLLFDERDVAGLTGHLADLCSSPQEREALRQRTRADAVENLDWTHTVAHFERLYERAREARA